MCVSSAAISRLDDRASAEAFRVDALIPVLCRQFDVSGATLKATTLAFGDEGAFEVAQVVQQSWVAALANKSVAIPSSCAASMTLPALRWTSTYRSTLCLCSSGPEAATTTVAHAAKPPGAPRHAHTHTHLSSDWAFML